MVVFFHQIRPILCKCYAVFFSVDIKRTWQETHFITFVVLI